MNIDTHYIRLAFQLPASPEDVYEALMNSEQHAALTGMPAQIQADPGGPFETCGKTSFGYSLDLVPGERIVQAWSHREFPPHTWTIVQIVLNPREGGTWVSFQQENVPLDCVEWVKNAWVQVYITPLKTFWSHIA